MVIWLTVVPDVIVNSLAVRIAFIALNAPIRCSSWSTPSIASRKSIQKLIIATKSILLQLSYKFGAFPCLLSRRCPILRQNGSAIESCARWAGLTFRDIRPPSR